MSRENKLEGWSGVIDEMAKQSRKRQEEERAEKARQMREHFDAGFSNLISKLLVSNDHYIDWEKDIPVMTNRAPDIILKSDKLLEQLWDEMYRRKMWHGYFAEQVSWAEEQEQVEAHVVKGRDDDLDNR